MRATTVAVPVYGKPGDVYGRRPVFLAAISIFLIGSALCGAAHGMTQLVVFRAIQGLGAGGLFPLALGTIGNIVPPRDRGRYQGLIGATFAAASIIGPAVGGFIVDNASWRWIFYVNLPVGGLALLVIALTMPRRSRADRHEHSIDWLGAGVLAAGTTALLLGLVLGGRQYAWSSARVVGPIVLVAGMLLLWRMNVHTTNGQAARNMVVAGIGIGSMMQVFVLSVQNAVSRRAMGSATALTQFSRSIGATIGVTIIGVIVNQGLPKQARGAGEGFGVHRLPPVFRRDLANALHPAFLAAAIVAALVWVIAVVGVKEVPLRKGFDEESLTDELAEGVPVEERAAAS